MVKCSPGLSLEYFPRGPVEERDQLFHSRLLGYTAIVQHHRETCKVYNKSSFNLSWRSMTIFSASLTPGSGRGKKSRSGYGLKILKFFYADPDPDLGCGIFFTLDPGSVMEKNSDPGSIPDPQQ
jgi:hypothetical protein